MVALVAKPCDLSAKPCRVGGDGSLVRAASRVDLRAVTTLSRLNSLARLLYYAGAMAGTLHRLKVSSRSFQTRYLLCAALGGLGSTGCADVDFIDAVVKATPDIWVKNSQRFNTPLSWESCPEGFATECAKLPVPIEWLDLSSESLEIMIARRPAKDPERAKGSVWVLDGGPGSNGSGLASGIDAAWSAFLGDYNVYTLVHRGTFHSGRLTCPVAESETSPGGPAILPEEGLDCVAEINEQWGGRLSSFRISHAARDLSHAIRRTRKTRESVFLYGFSYGTLLASRLAQIAPYQVNGVILDGILPNNGISYFDYDRQFDDVAKSMAQLCAADDFCADKWGSDPWTSMQNLKEKLENGHCHELEMSPAQLSQLTARLLTGSPTREAVFAILYRVDRCEEADRSVVKHFFATLAKQQEEGAKAWDPRAFSMPLLNNILFAEVVGGGKLDIPTVEQTGKACEEALFCPGYSQEARRLYDHWPHYTPDRFYGQDVHFRVPVLAMNGVLDPQTPINHARDMAKHLRGPGQSFVELPLSPHMLWLNSAVKTEGELSCAGQMVSQFLVDPFERVDKSCVDDLVGLNFQGSTAFNEQLFGVADAWENQASLALSQRYEQTIDWEQVIDALGAPLRDVGSF